MPIDTDEDLLIKYGCKQRSETLAGTYRDMVAIYQCLCPTRFGHGDDSMYCPKAIWERAARMALEMDD